ncbi:MAG: GWxTD domain-containing protein [Gemmatimonadota bacterium]|nr:MAG: GWxTD domain-containing protein [Gemmatimonadota bacterium]
MTRWHLLAILFPLWLLGGCSVGRYADVQGGPSKATGDLQFTIDVALFQVCQDTVEAVIFITFPNSSLTFLKRERGFTAAYDGTIELNTLSEKPVVAKAFEGQIEEPSYEAAHSSSGFDHRELSLKLVPGTYALTVTLQDRNSLRKGTVRRVLDVVPFAQDKITLSSIVFAAAVERDSSGGFRIVPNSERIYGERLPELKFYFEVYAPGKIGDKGTLRVQYKIVSRQTGNSLFLDERDPIEPGTEKTAVSGTCHLRGIDEEDASLLIRVLDREQKILAERKGDFRISWPLINWGNDFELSLTQLELVASAEVIAEYKRIEPERREAFLRRYWKERDPIPQTEQNELLIEFEKRLRYAKRELGGMRTDKGRVSIQNGPPQAVEKRILRDMIGYPRSAEIWIYFEPYREFVFIEDRLVQR